MTGNVAMSEEEKEFKVVDKRRFSEEGKVREHEGEEAKGPEPEPEGARSSEGEGDRGGPSEQQLPPADFTTFIISMGASALMHLGDTPNPATNTVEPNLSLARHTIDTLAMLQEKTKGNLTEDEGRMFEGLLTDLKMRYVKASG
ncbi:MAG: DUF1844 domain-containing protein [Thermodesulfobacteriota bacterium]